MFEGKSSSKHSEFEGSYQDMAPRLERLRTTVNGMVLNSLSEANIEVLQIQSRVKNLGSAYSKAELKGYDAPLTEITDLVGVRIILFLEHEVEDASHVLEKIFEIDQENSIDKRFPSRAGSVGYRSLHVIAMLGDRRNHLPEYESISGQKFEIQIRTALQHAWAEIEHKRNYKSENSLPSDLQHRLMRISGTLEMIDQEFSQISIEANQYSETLKENASGTDHVEAISIVALNAVFEGALEMCGLEKNKVTGLPNQNLQNSNDQAIVDELISFGVQNVDQLRGLASEVHKSDIQNFNARGVRINGPRFYRTAMMKRDLNKFFEIARAGRIKSIDADNIAALVAITGRNDLAKLFERNGIMYIPF